MYHHNNIQVYICLDLLQINFMELRKYIRHHQTDNIEKLPIRPIASNINTPTYQFAKYLAK